MTACCTEGSSAPGNPGTVPVTVLFGDNDKLLTVEQHQVRSPGTHHARWIVMPRVGHAPCGTIRNTVLPRSVRRPLRHNAGPARPRQRHNSAFDRSSAGAHESTTRKRPPRTIEFVGAAEGQVDGDAATQDRTFGSGESRAANVRKAVGHMGRDRRAVGRHPGLTFTNSLGTGSGRTFTMRATPTFTIGPLLTVFRDRVCRRRI